MPVSNFSELKVIIDLEGEFLTRGNQKRASFSIIIKFFLDISLLPTLKNTAASALSLSSIPRMERQEFPDWNNLLNALQNKFFKKEKTL